MHRDVKIGLSLGLLLVVVVAALFFRRNTDRTDAPPHLVDAQSVDQRIAERERSPYAGGLNEFPEPPAAPPSQRKPPVISTAAPTDRNPVPDFLTADDGALHRRIVAGSPSVPDPIPSSLGAPDAAPRLPASKGAQGQQTHVIKKGDTLSGLAQKYLGDAGRFQEIYDANKSLLKTPNQLPEDVTIVIPPRDRPVLRENPRETASQIQLQGVDEGDRLDAPAEPATSEARPSATVENAKPVESAKPGVSASPTTPSPDANKKRLTKPVRRSPFTAGRAAVGDAGPGDRNEVP